MSSVSQSGVRHAETRPLKRPSACVVAAATLIVGTATAPLLPLRPELFGAISAVWICAAAVCLYCGRGADGRARRLRGSSTGIIGTSCIVIGMLALSIFHWQLHQPLGGETQLGQFCGGEGGRFVRLRATIISVPVVHVSPADKFSLQRDSPPQTRFRAAVSAVVIDAREQVVAGTLQAYVSGDAAGSSAIGPVVSLGDNVLLTGRLTWPNIPGNPGDFDFPNYLRQQQISAQLFVVDPHAITVVQKVAAWNPRRWVSLLRQLARDAIVDNVHPKVQGIALALLLGNRHQLPFELEESFISSGTMHLLAISGLHVGILCLFLLRLANILLLPRRKALVMTVVICVVYAMVTDLRPSVVRATVFFVVFAVSQFVGRKTGVLDLLAITVVIMVFSDPNLVFNIGAWLSFLAVAALGRVSGLVAPDEDDREAPLDAITEIEKFGQRFAEVRAWLSLRYRQATFVLVATTPLVAAAFHVLSPVGLVVNIALIPVILGCLCAGFTTLFVGMLVPPMAFIPGTIFSWSLGALMAVVDWSASVLGGHVYIPDLPVWFLPVYYVLLTVVLFSAWPRLRAVTRTALLVSVLLAFHYCSVPRTSPGLRLTVLDIGHGSAAVLEMNGQVWLLDAGAMSRSERSTNVVCGYLWNRGYHKVDGVLISHADMDHYNAVPGVMRRMPIGEIRISSEFLHSSAAAVQTLIRSAKEKHIPVALAFDGDSSVVAGVELTIHQADISQLASNAQDNEKSLVLVINYAGRRMIVPGDIEGAGLEQLVELLGAADVLVSPHHGSVLSNTPQLASCVNPTYVVASARNAISRPVLENVFAEAQSVLYTSESGAVTVSVQPDGSLQISEFRVSTPR